MLSAPGGASFPFLGVSEVLHGRVSADALLCPPDCIGDPDRQLSANQLANQVRVRVWGYDTRRLEAWAWPKLTAVRQPAREPGVCIWGAGALKVEHQHLR